MTIWLIIAGVGIGLIFAARWLASDENTDSHNDSAAGKPFSSGAPRTGWK